MDFEESEIAELRAGAPRRGLFLRLAVDPVLRCWLGFGPIDVGVNTLDPAGVLYKGYGPLLNLPSLGQLINGAFERLDLSLSGLDDRILALATSANEVQGVRCSVGFGLFGNDWQLLAPVHWTRHYVADFLRMDIAPAGDPTGQTMKTATLSIGSMMTGRRRAGRSYYNNQDQQARSLAVNPTLPADRYSERTSIYSQIGNKTWPKFA